MPSAKLRQGVDQLLPPNPQMSSCQNESATHLCFKAGDARVNVNQALTSFHTLFVREHNRLVDILKDTNPNLWTEDIFYQVCLVLIISLDHTVT